MPETRRSRVDLEELALEAVQRAEGCSHVIDVELRYVETNGKRPNWRLVGTTPPLPPAVLYVASMVVEKLADQFLMIDG
jgi:hypothetical protein